MGLRSKKPHGLSLKPQCSTGITGLNDEPLRHADADEIYRANIARLVARGSFTPPAETFPGARYIPPGESPAEDDWEQVRGLWPPPDGQDPPGQ